MIYVLICLSTCLLIRLFQCGWHCMYLTHCMPWTTAAAWLCSGNPRTPKGSCWIQRPKTAMRPLTVYCSKSLNVLAVHGDCGIAMNWPNKTPPRNNEVLGQWACSDSSDLTIPASSWYGNRYIVSGCFLGIPLHRKYWGKSFTLSRPEY